MQSAATKTKTQSKPGTRRTFTPPQDVTLPDFDPSLVCPAGDLVLSVTRHQSQPAPRHQSQTAPPHQSQTAPPHQTDTAPVYLYRVDSNQLRKASPYFARLLDPNKFIEGAHVATQHAELRSTYPNPAAVPFDRLPRVHIADLGRIAPAVKSIQNLMSDFLRILHDQPLSVKLPPLSNVANLVIVADRFDALASMRSYFHTRKLLAALDSPRSSSSKTSSSAKPEAEERVRQKLLIGLLLDNPIWVTSTSLRLIQKGWVGNTAPPSTALWWDIPHDIEDELLFRRDILLDTIQSLQSHFLDLYTSRHRQCKLGYDSSPECDLYQLGQAVKFFRKIDTLVLAGNIIGLQQEEEREEGKEEEEEEEKGEGGEQQEISYKGDLFDLLDQLRKIPSYQIDKNHHHCGVRTRLLPLLDLISQSLLSQDVGICLQCWHESRHEYSWKRVKRPLVWRHDGAAVAMGRRGGGGDMVGGRSQAQRHLRMHGEGCEMWLAGERCWTEEGGGEGNKGVGWSHPNLSYRS